MTTNPTTDRVEQIAVDLIDPDPDNRPAAIDDAFQTSVAQHGVLMPILVTPTDDGRYRLVAGERRYRAAVAAGHTHHPGQHPQRRRRPPRRCGRPSRTLPASTSPRPRKPARWPGSWPPE